MSLDNVDWSTIPAPEDDGAASHLMNRRLPDLSLESTEGGSINLSRESGRLVVYAYPMTGQPGKALPDGWDAIPGARGCTPQSCAFRDHADELRQQGVQQIFGLSTQSGDYQSEAAQRLSLPFPLLSDVNLELQQALDLPVLSVDNMTLLKRLTLIIDDGVITQVFYPVFPPDNNAAIVLDWLTSS